MRVRIHRFARVGFARGAEAYERARPGYPADAVAWLVERTGITPRTTIVDLAAGTGKLTRALAATGAHVLAVEPVAAMRRQFPGDIGADVVDGTAEDIPLCDSSADLVTVAEAFHWFRGDEALREIHRVLRPGGSLALLWNRLDANDELGAAFQDVLERNRGHEHIRDTGEWRQAFERTSLFTEPELRSFGHVHELDVDALVARAASETSIAILPEAHRRQVLGEVRGLARGRNALRYITEAEIRRWVDNVPPGTSSESPSKETR